MTDVLPEVLPDGTAVQQRSPLLLVLALVGALLLGAGSAVVIYALVDDEPIIQVTAPATTALLHQTTADEISGAQAMTKDEATTAVAISGATTAAALPASQTARDDGTAHAQTMSALGERP